MVRLVFGGRMRVRAMLLASMALIVGATLRPAMAEQEFVGRQVVTLTAFERFEGEVAPVIVVCPLVGTCTAKVRIAVRGRPHEYSLIVSAPRGRARISLLFLSKTSTTPRLRFGQGDSLDVELQPDGTGLHDAAITALGSGYKYPGFSPIEPAKPPLANVRVTVRREGTAGRNR